MRALYQRRGRKTTVFEKILRTGAGIRREETVKERERPLTVRRGMYIITQQTKTLYEGVIPPEVSGVAASSERQNARTVLKE